MSDLSLHLLGEIAARAVVPAPEHALPVYARYGTVTAISGGRVTVNIGGGNTLANLRYVGSSPSVGAYVLLLFIGRPGEGWDTVVMGAVSP